MAKLDKYQQLRDGTPIALYQKRGYWDGGSLPIDNIELYVVGHDTQVLFSGIEEGEYFRAILPHNIVVKNPTYIYRFNNQLYIKKEAIAGSEERERKELIAKLEGEFLKRFQAELEEQQDDIVRELGLDPAQYDGLRAGVYRLFGYHHDVNVPSIDIDIGIKTNKNKSYLGVRILDLRGNNENILNSYVIRSEEDLDRLLPDIFNTYRQVIVDAGNE